MKRFFETLFVPLAGLFLLLAGLLIANTVVARADEHDEAFLPAIHSQSAPSSSDWSMVAANPQRTSRSAEEVTGRLQVEWYRPIEAYIPQNSQIIAANGLLYISTSRGLYALHAATGDLVWRYDTELPLGNSPTVANGVVYAGGHDRRLHALDALSGAHLWSFDGAEAGYDTNPLVVDGVVYAGNRDGAMYAVGADGTPNQGQLIWKYETGGPIHLSAAYQDGAIYFAAADNYAYALDAANGNLIWKSGKLPGDEYHSYWPVIYQDKVIFSVAFAYQKGVTPGTRSVTNDEGVGFPSYKYMQLADIFPEQVEGSVLGPEVSGQGWGHGYPVVDASRVTEYLEDNPAPDPHKHKPWRRMLVVLNRSNGSEYTFDSDGDGHPEYIPATYWGTGSGNRYPPVVGPDNILYFSNLYQCCSDAKGRVMGWQMNAPSYLSILEGFGAVAEPQAISVGGDVIYRNLCCDRVGDWFNIMDPGPRRELWSYDLANEAPSYDQMWTVLPGWPRLHGYYKGNSNSVNAAYHNHGDQNPIVPYDGRLYAHRSNAIVAYGPGSGRGQLPLLAINEGQGEASTLTEAELINRLEGEVQKMLDAGHLRPGYYNVTPFLARGLDTYFDNPGETLHTLTRAYPHLSSQLQDQVRDYLQEEFNRYFDPEMYARIGWADGAPRESIALPPEVEADLFNYGPSVRAPHGFIWTYPQYNFYAMWKYAEIFPEEAAHVYELAKDKLQVPVPNAPTGDYFLQQPYELNGWIAGYIGFLELQELAGMSAQDGRLRANVNDELNRLMQLRVNTFSKDSYWYDDRFYKKQLDISSNFLFLVPELGGYMNQQIASEVEEAVAEYEYIAPYWFVSRYEAAIGEGVNSPAYHYYGLFQAKAYILQESQAELSKYVDVPGFRRGDLFYIQNLVAAIEADN